MASPSTAEDADAPSGDATPLPGTVQVAAGLHARRIPLIATPRVRILEGIGDVGRAARRFSALTGLSLSARRAMQAQRSDVGHQPVRPPDFWTGYQEEEVRLGGRSSTGDAALDRLIARRATMRREASARPRVQRGLPSTIHRRSHSLAGPMTAPGGMARRLLPATVVPAPNPANSPQTAASREPRPARPARPGQRDGDRPRPAGPPAPATSGPTTSRAASAEAAARTAARSADAPTGRPARLAASSAEGAPLGATAASAGGTVGAPAASAVGSPATSTVRRRVAGAGTPDALLARRADDVEATDTVAAERGAVAPAERRADTWASEPAPAWPGDLAEPGDAPSPVTTGVGRPVAVRPLLAGWRAPTAWRSIAAAPGLRLLPVGPSALPTAWSSAAAGGDDGAASWSETVRRTVQDASNGPGAVRDLPVGGPAVVVRDGAAADGSAAASPAARHARGQRHEVRRRGATDTWSTAASSGRGSASADGAVFLRRQVTGSPSGPAVDVTAWTLPPAAARPGRPSTSSSPGSVPSVARSTATDGASGVDRTVRRSPGFRPGDSRRPGAWLGRAAAGGGLAAAVQRVPQGPLGPVRWSARADEPVVARTTSPASSASSWAASVASASAAMAGTAALTGAAIRPPVANGLTLVRGGRADGSDLPVTAVQRSSTHPAATRLRLVPPVEPPGTAAPVVRRTAAEAGTPTASTVPTAAASVPTAYVGRTPAGSVPFVSIPGAVAAHGLPAARAALVGVTASGPAAGGVATPGVLGRLVHGEPIRRRLALDLAPPAFVMGSTSATATAAARAGTAAPATGAAPVARATRPGLPVTPAALVRRRAVELPGSSSARAAGAPTSWAARVAASSAPAGSPAALASLMASGPAGSSVAQRVAASSASSTTSAPSARPARPEPASSGRAAATPSSSDPAPIRRTSNPSSTTDRTASGPTWAERVAAAGQGRSLAASTAASSSTATAPGSLLSAPVYATGGPSVASLRGLPVAPAAFGVVRGADVVTGERTTVARRSTADGDNEVVHRSRTPHGVSATVARRAHHRSSVADRWSSSDVPARTLPGRAPASLRPIASPPVVRRSPMRASAPGAAARFDEVLRSAEAPVRPVALPVRFRPLAERIVGRMPVQIATGAASRRALEAVGTTAATTGSVIHLPSAPDGSARMAGILAHELTHVAAASPVARFHGGRPSIEETAATQVERIVARAARTSGTGRGPASPGTSGLPVGGFVGVKGAAGGPPVPASVAGSTAASTAASIGSSSDGGSGSSSGGTVQRVVATSEAPAPTRPSKAANRRVQRKSAPSGLESVQEAADETTVLTDDALDAIVRALEARLLESIERRGGLWRGGF